MHPRSLPSEAAKNSATISFRAMQFFLSLGVAAVLNASAQSTNLPAERLQFIAPPVTGKAEGSLRYSPDHGDFVITNGAEFFNRPLYGNHNAFRVDGGDKPEFSMYLPGRGGNLRLGIKSPLGVKWLNDADKIITRYRGGELIYEIHDALLMNNRQLNLAVLPLTDAKGFIVRAEMNSAWMPIQLVWAFGGANGVRGSRGGDIGCERKPVGQLFQLSPEDCRGNGFTIRTNRFVLRGKSAAIAGIFPANSKLHVGDATKWDSPKDLLSVSTNKHELSVAAGEIEMPNEQPVYLALLQTTADGNIFSTDELPKLFNAVENHRREIAGRVTVETPDEFINAAVPALNIAADAIWDDAQEAFMHGAVAWRQRLLGWRGPFAGDALGWHDRTATHFLGYAQQQNTDAIPEKIPAPEESANLSRNENALHSNGDLMNRSHYDMNLLAVDAFFRHLLWTGDMDFARTNWPVIERHFGWERRLFRREFGPEKLPLYEAYAAIWASDDLAYNGGGATHSTALNFFANKNAARVAKLLGKDSAPYEREADLILQAMQKYLWLPDEENFAEFKDYLGEQLVHPNAALWTFYHTVDSEVPSPDQAWQMAKWMDGNLAHIPIATSDLKSKISNDGTTPFVLPTTSWLPYQWSLNNVVVGEDAHAALGFWQAGHADTAFALFKGTLLDTMFGGLCPGNVGCMTRHDAVRGEAQRDFADGIGATARALVEGLFGVRPDALSGELKITPGFPVDWNSAKISHPDFRFEFQREHQKEHFSVQSKFPVPMQLKLQIPALGREISSAIVNGKTAQIEWLTNLPGSARVEIVAPTAASWEVELVWKGDAQPVNRGVLARVSSGQTNRTEAFDWKKTVSAAEKLEAISLADIFNDRLTQIFRNEYRAPRSPFASLATPKQGIGSWCHPQDTFAVDDTGLRALAEKSGGKIILPNGVPLTTPGTSGAKNIAFVSQWENYPKEISVPLVGKSSHAFLLMAGSTGAMQSRIDNGEVVVTYADNSTTRLALNNPTTWWPIDQDYFIDDFAFARPEPLPVRVDLATGKIRVLQMDSFKGRGRTVPGGAATVLEVPLDDTKELKSLTVRALANEVVIGLMSVTLQR